MLTIPVGVIDVFGDESGEFLHAIVSSDVLALEVGTTQESLLLEPSGHLISAFWINRQSENKYRIVVHNEFTEKTQSNLSKYLIRTKATIENRNGRYSAQITNEPADAIIKGYLDDENIYVVLTENTALDDRKEHEAMRVKHGVVSLKEIEGIIPQEACLERKAVSFTKGCYLGQELVCRIDSREASTPFKFYWLSYDGPDGAKQVFANNKVIGEINTSESFEGTTYSIARISREGASSITASEPISVAVGSREITVDSINRVTGAFSL